MPDKLDIAAEAGDILSREGPAGGYDGDGHFERPYSYLPGSAKASRTKFRTQEPNSPLGNDGQGYYINLRPGQGSPLVYLVKSVVVVGDYGKAQRIEGDKPWSCCS